MDHREGHSLSEGSNSADYPNPTLPTSSIAAMDKQHCIKILVATDNHIGYAESDPIRGQDSINTFREILQLAVSNDVDMLLLAGDLFHENRPSRASLYSTIASLREFCLNSRPIQIELVGDAGIGIPHSFNFPPVNYEDENINVGLPVFSIHGNHDDPQGMGPEGALCALDVLSAAGLINYFGRQELPGTAQNDAEACEQGLHIQPVLLQKGRTRLAIYGIGNIRDERFNYEMRSNRIRMSRPVEFKDEWFNLMLVHQNRVAHGPKNSVPEDGFGDDADLIIWGHEHDCLIEPQEIPGKGYYISQPGSSVATSLAKGESLKKHVAILKIQDRDFSMVPIPLKTVRPFIFHDIVLAEEEEEHKLKLDEKPKVIKYLKKLVEELISKANAEWEADQHARDSEEDPDGQSANDPSSHQTTRMLPLIRLRVEYTHSDGQTAFEVGNPQRFGQDFIGKVANPKDLVQFYRRKKFASRKPKNEIDLPEDRMIQDSQGRAGQPDKIQVATLVNQYLEAQNLSVLEENGMQKAVTLFVEKDDKDAIKEFYQKALKKSQGSVKKLRAQLDEENRHQDRNPESEDEELVAQITKAKEDLADEWDKDEELDAEKEKAKAARNKKRNDDDSDESDFGKMSDIQRVVESDDSEEQSDPGSQHAPKAPIKKAAPLKKTAPAKKAPPKRAPAKTPATSSRTKRDGSQGRITQPPVRAASKRNVASQSCNQQLSDDSNDSIEVSTKRKVASRSRR